MLVKNCDALILRIEEENVLFECVTVVHFIVYGKFNGNGSPLPCLGVEGVVGVFEICYCEICVVAVAVVNAYHSAGLVINAEGNAEPSAVIGAAKHTALEATRA